MPTKFAVRLALTLLKLCGSGVPERMGRESTDLLDISPDDRRLAYIFYDEEAKRWRTKVRALDGEASDQVFGFTPAILRWMPDGRRLICFDADKSSREILIQPLAGGPPKTYLRFEGNSVIYDAILVKRGSE